MYIYMMYIYILHTHAQTRKHLVPALFGAAPRGKWTKTILLSQWNSCPMDSPMGTSSATATRKKPSSFQSQRASTETAGPGDTWG